MAKMICNKKVLSKAKNPRLIPCRKPIFKDGLCKDHAPPQLENEALSIYIDGISRMEENFYPLIPIGDLSQEIKMAKLQLRRLYLKKMEYDAKPEDASRMYVGSLTLKDALIRDGQLIDNMGVPLDLTGRLNNGNEAVVLTGEPIVESSLTLIRPTFEADIDKMLNLIIKLEKTHFEMKGGITDDPNSLAQQIKAALAEIECNATGD